MMGQQGYAQGQKAVQDMALRRAGELFSAGDIRGAQAAAAQGGSLQALMGFSNLANSDRDFAFRRQEAQRAQGNTEASRALQERQFAQSAAAQAAAQALQRQQFAWQQEQGNRPEIQMVEDEMGRKIPVLIDRKTNAVRPLNTSAAFGTPAPSNIPPGVDAATYRKEAAKDAIKSSASSRDLMEGGKVVMGMVDQLEKKIGVGDPQTAKRFGSAAGPFVGAFHDLPTWDPRRLGYEALQSRESKAYLDQIKQDAQGINTVMQRALLKGGGQITENERAQINEILGKISQARSVEDAQALLTNFRGIVRKLFQMPEPSASGATTRPAPQAAPSNLPSLPPGFELVK